ncbi:MAG: hypothetical protein NVSMB62_01030 [Acidobacteriaceae bacterium]
MGETIFWPSPSNLSAQTWRIGKDDSSEEFRTREEASLHQMLAGSRIAVSAISHEIHNVCGAIAVVHRNLSREQNLAVDKDFEALGNLLLALERIAVGQTAAI